MSKNALKLKIAYLYPDLLHGFSDCVNVQTFATRANWRDIDIQINYINSNDKIQASKYDFYYIGGNNIQNLEYTLHYLKQNEDEIKVAAMSGVPMLCVNCGYMLFGNYYQLHNKAQVEGLKILDVDSIAGKIHHWGAIYGSCEFLKNKIVAGFENHGILSYLKQNAAPSLKIHSGLGNNGKDRTEGARFNNVVGTYITTPIFAQNPHLCDFFIATALRIKYRCRIPLTPLCDDIEWYSHNYILEMK